MAEDFLIAIDTNILLILSKKQDERRIHVEKILQYVYNTSNGNIFIVVPHLVLLEYIETLIRWSTSEYLIKEGGYRFGEIIGQKGKEIRIKKGLPDSVIETTLEPIYELCANPEVKLLKNSPDWKFACSLVKMGLEARDAVILSQIAISPVTDEKGCDLFVTTDREILALAGKNNLLKKTKIKRVSTPKGAVSVLEDCFGVLK